MGSYNYLGFAENEADSLKTVADTTLQYGVGVCSTRHEIGDFLAKYVCYFKSKVSYWVWVHLWKIVQPLLLCAVHQLSDPGSKSPAHIQARESLELLHICLFYTVSRKNQSLHIRNGSPRGDANTPRSRRPPHADRSGFSSLISPAQLGRDLLVFIVEKWGFFSV